MKYLLFGLLLLQFLWSCNSDKKNILPKADEVLHKNEKNLTDLIIYDIFSPPVAARIYSYTSLAAYEVLRFEKTNEPSIVAKLKGFAPMPEPDKNKKYNYVLAASVAFYSVTRELTFSKDTITKFENETFMPFKNALSKNVFDNSFEFGKAVAAKIMERAKKDNYIQTRALEKFYGNNEGGNWRPTNPDYMDGTEPYWTRIMAFSLDSSSQFDPGQIGRAHV